jgi:hypothetical protein
MSGKIFLTHSNVRKNFFEPPPLPRSPTFLGKIVARNILQGIIGYGRAILADMHPPN